MNSMRLCDDEAKEISCDSGKVLNITGAIYGRSSRFTWCSWSLTGDCEATGSLDVVRGLCQHKQSCSLQARSATFGDPCPGVKKYLNVEYNCGTAGDAQNLGVVIGLIVAGIAMLFIIAIVILMVIRYKRKGSTKSEKTPKEAVLDSRQTAPVITTTVEVQYEEVNEGRKTKTVTYVAPVKLTTDVDYQDSVGLAQGPPQQPEPRSKDTSTHLTVTTTIPGANRQGTSHGEASAQETAVKHVRDEGQPPHEPAE